MAGGQSERNNERRDLAAVLEGVPSPSCLDDERPAAGRLCSGGSCSCASPTSGASAAADRLPVPLATAGCTCPTARALELWSAGSDRSGSIRFSAGSAIPLPRSDRRLGERALAHLSLPRDAGLWSHQAGRLHVRSRRTVRRQPRCEERAPSVSLSAASGASA